MSRVPATHTKPTRDVAPPPPVTVGVASGELARFTEFSTSMMRLILPPGSHVNWCMDLDVTANFNRIANEMLDNQPDSSALWLMGDDHIFAPTLLAQLLARDVDVVVPLCLQRHAPFKPVVYSGIEGEDHNGFPLYTVAQLPHTGIHEIFACGSAGMLIRRHVLEALERPIFSTSGLHQNEDLNLCAKIREAGFKIHCDVDARLGHIGIVGIFPMWSEDRWAAELQSGDAVVPVYPYEADVLPIGAHDGVHRTSDRQHAQAL